MQPQDAGEPKDRALLIGVSEYDFTKPPHGVPGDLPAVRHNLTMLREALVRGRVFAEQEIRTLPSPYLADTARVLQRAAKEARGLLLVYFAGHGAIPSGGDELYLQMRDARVIAGEHTVFSGAEKFSDLMATVLATSAARRIVVVLDCCFAGNAARVWELFGDKRRVAVLMSVQANHRIDAGDPKTPTPFTEELAAVLGEGGGTIVSELAARLRERMAARGLRTERGDPWEPQLRVEAGVDVPLGKDDGPQVPLPGPGLPGLPGGPGGASDPGPPGPGPDPRPPWWPAVLKGWRSVLAVLRRWLSALSALKRWWLALTVLLALGLLGLGLYCALGPAGDGAHCAPPLELRVLTDPDLERPVRAAADAYLGSEENTTDAGCRRTGVTVYSAGSSDVVGALRRHTGDWQEPRDDDVDPQRDLGPQPDVWIPASRADVDRVRAEQDTDAVAVLEPREPPLAYSPIVLAVPQQIAADAYDERTGLNLTEMIQDLTARAEDADVRRPDPEFTDSGLLATVGLYGADASAVASGERLVAQSGSPSPTAGDLLCALPDDDTVDDRTAALVPEFLLRSGVDCDSTTRSPRMAQYPQDVPGVEPVFVRVRWNGGDRDGTERDAAASAFRDWLAGEDGRAVFAGHGFRSAYTRELLDGETVADGVLRAPSPLDESAGRDAMERALRAYQAYGGPGRVLFLLDSSGSMADLWQGPSGGPGLLRQSLGGLGAEDEYGVWSVADTDDGPYETLLGIGAHRRTDAQRAVEERARVRDATADPHAALLSAFDAMDRRGGDGRPQMIVHITDGEHGEALSGGRLTEVLDRAGASGVPVTVAVLGSGGCDPGRPDRRIADASGGRCLDAGDDLGAALHDEIARTGTGEG
ncbi:substrate-binding domain-containing protein [Streptomyces sp. MA15]|uniref:vWA domain-containing protein n=1 Tax=Streptomyces sp. MA15 TaxID=3055061 RepID=UPI0025AF2BD3|nr:substrate-binding domain-containing protein [Streptomyces sp. MA15]MDN3266672.1 substrate-binding domain-containing protein [Streptomyces sp. MA15]